MGRPYPAAAGQNMVSNPYPKPKETQPINTTCEVCERIIMTKDWTAHKNSKKHREAEDVIHEKENRNGNVSSSEWTKNGFGGHASELGAASGDSGFGAVETTYSKGGFGGSHPSTGGGGGKACHTCGAEGHIKRDCPISGTNKRAGGCFNCGEVGHNKVDCPNLPQGGARACYNCGQAGHVKAECPETPKGGGTGANRACFNCGQTGHNKVDCPNARQGNGGGGGGGPCHNCGQEGHRKAECTNERVMICRNCDGIGHMSKECPQPRDWSRVKCNNCGNMGHTVKRCPEPIKEQDNGFGDGGGFQLTDSGAAAGSWTELAAEISRDWANEDVGGDGLEGGNDWDVTSNDAGGGW